MYLKHAVWMILLLGLIFACKNKSTNVQEAEKNVFVAKFIDNWLRQGSTGYIFISDMDGNVLADSSWQGDAVLNLKQSDGSDFPDKIMVTTVTIDSNRRYVDLATNMAVAPATWIWKGYPSLDYSRKIYFNYHNIPEHSGYLIAVHYRAYIGSTIDYMSSMIVPFNLNDIYFYLNTSNNGPEYLWLTDKNAGDTVDVDFANLKELTKHTIIFPGWGKGYRGFISGYPSANDHYTRSYILQYFRETDSVATSFAAYYPKGLFASYRTSLYIYDDYQQKGSGTYYHYLKYGSSLPNEFIKMNADFEFKGGPTAELNIETSGNFDEIESYWQYSADETSFRWRVYGPENMTSYQLPFIPSAILSKINGLNRESFTNTQVFLIDQFGLNSYAEIISTYFKSGKHFYDVVDGSLLRAKENPQAVGDIMSAHEAENILQDGQKWDKEEK